MPHWINPTGNMASLHWILGQRAKAQLSVPHFLFIHFITQFAHAEPCQCGEQKHTPHIHKSSSISHKITLFVTLCYRYKKFFKWRGIHLKIPINKWYNITASRED